MAREPRHLHRLLPLLDPLLRRVRSSFFSSRLSSSNFAPRVMTPVCGSRLTRVSSNLLSPITNNGSSCGDLFLNLLHGMSSLELHEEVQQHTEQDDGDDDQSTDSVTQRQRCTAGNKKDDDQWIGN